MWFAVLTFLLASCGTAKQVTYFQDIRPGSDDSIRVVSEMRLMPDDKLSIVVSSKNQELALLFNLPTVSYRMGQASTTSTNTNGQVSAYTVDSDGEIDFPVLGKIKVAGMKAGVALNPHTPVHALEDILQDLDVVLLMSVNPGFGGQSFIPHTLEKVRKLRALLSGSGSPACIEIDGGVNFDTGRQLLAAGADALVAGSFVFKSSCPEETIRGLKNL